MNKITKKDLANAKTPYVNFYEYFMEFYGKGGIYDYDAQPDEFSYALYRRLVDRPDFPFEGDSFDRELVRDIMLAERSR